MKKTILFILFTLLLTSCFGGEEKVEEGKKVEKVKVVENKITKLENLVNNQNFDKAIPELEKLYNSNSEEIGNILNYASALLAKGSITRQEKEYSKKALEVLNKALEQFPKNSELYRYIGYAYEIAEDYKKAFKTYDKSIELDSNNALAYSNRGHAYKLFGDYKRAEKDFLKAYSLDKTNDFVLINLAWVYNIALFDFDEALKYYNKAIKNTYNIRFKSEAYYSMGNIYMGKRKYDEAEKAFKNAIKADQKFELGYLGLSEVQMAKLIKNKDTLKNEEKNMLLKEALKNNEVAIKLNPGRAISYYKKGLIIKDMKGFENQANFMFKMALDILKTDITLSKKQKDNLEIYITNQIKNEK